MFKGFFSDFYTQTTGVYKVYGLTHSDVEDLRRKHDGKVSGCAPTVTIYDEAVTRALLCVYVPERNSVVRFNIREELLALSGMKVISKKFSDLLKENFPKTIYIKYINGSWYLVHPELVKETVEKCGYLKKEKKTKK